MSPTAKVEQTEGRRGGDGHRRDGHHHRHARARPEGATRATTARGGEKGDPFEYADFTSEQLEALRGPQGRQDDVRRPHGGRGRGASRREGRQGRPVHVSGLHVGAAGGAARPRRACRGLRAPTARTGRTARRERTGPTASAARTRWSGSVLTVTSASGTSSADLRGPKGDAFTYEDFTAEQRRGAAGRGRGRRRAGGRRPRTGRRAPTGRTARTPRSRARPRRVDALDGHAVRDRDARRHAGGAHVRVRLLPASRARPESRGPQGAPGQDGEDGAPGATPRPLGLRDEAVRRPRAIAALDDLSEVEF